MAQKVRVEYVSDISGESYEDGKGRTVRFALDGREYEIDLTDKEEKALTKALDPYIQNGRKPSRAKRSSTGGATPPRSNEAAKIREWAQNNGYEISSRGRVNSEIQEAYYAANK